MFGTLATSFNELTAQVLFGGSSDLSQINKEI